MTGSLPEQQANILDQLTQYILGVALTENNIIVNVRYVYLFHISNNGGPNVASAPSRPLPYPTTAR